MTGVIVAFAASFPVGVALGVVSATCARGSLRPCRRLREHGTVAVWVSALVALAGGAMVGVAAAQVDYQRAFLVVTCGAIVLVVAVTSWLLLVETDEGDAHASDDEPEWWPTFERDFEEWTRRTRVLSR